MTTEYRYVATPDPSVANSLLPNTTEILRQKALGTGPYTPPAENSGTTTPTNLSIASRTDETLAIASSTGTPAVIPAATTSGAGLMSAADKTALDAGGSPGGGGSVIVENALVLREISTKADGTVLVGQAADIGGVWQSVGSFPDAVIQDGKIKGVSGFASAGINLGDSEYLFTCDLDAPTAAGKASAVYFRTTQALTNGWLIQSADGQLNVYRKTGATYALVVSSSHALNSAAVKLKIAVTALNFIIYRDDVVLLASTGSDSPLYSDGQWIAMAADEASGVSNVEVIRAATIDELNSSDPVYYLLDDLIGADGTSLTGRDPTVGDAWQSTVSGPSTPGILTIQNNGIRNLNSTYGDAFSRIPSEEYDLEIKFGKVGALSLTESLFIYLKSNAVGSAPYQYVVFYNNSDTTAGLSCYSGSAPFSSQAPSAVTFLSTGNVLLAKVRQGSVAVYLNGVFFGAVPIPINKDFTGADFVGFYMAGGTNNAIIEDIKVKPAQPARLIETATIYDSIVANYFSSYATTATSRRKQAANDFVTQLKEEGIWDLLYTVWINSGDSEANVVRCLKGSSATLSRSLSGEINSKGGITSSSLLLLDWGAPIALDTNYSIGYALNKCSDATGLKAVLQLGKGDEAPGSGITIGQTSANLAFPLLNFISYGSEKIEDHELGGFYVTRRETGLYPFKAGTPKPYTAGVPNALSSASAFNLALYPGDGVAAAVYGQSLTRAQASKVSQLLDELARKF